MTTVATLITNVRNEIIEPTAGFWTDVEITKWLNESYRELVTTAEMESVTTTSFDTVDGTELYNLASDFDRIVRAERESEAGSDIYRPLQQLTINSREDNTPVVYLRAYPRTPTGFYLWPRAGADLFSIGLIPVPDLSGVGVRVYYYQKAATLVSADIPILAEKYLRLMELYAIAMAKLKADDSAYSVYQDHYIAGVQALRIDVLSRKRGASRFQVVRDVG